MTKNDETDTPESIETPAEPIDIDPPAEDPEAVVEINATEAPVTTPDVMKFKRSAPLYDLSLLDDLIESGRGDIATHRDAISDAVNAAPARSDLMKDFKTQFQKKRVLNMPLLNEAVNNNQDTARDLRGNLWKTIKSLPKD